MKTILCFGDSNTWGYDPVSRDRHPYENRWTTVLQRELGSDYLVIPEGLNGRTTVWEDPIERHRCGIDYLPACLESHKPLDLVIIALGSNDLKARFSVPPSDVAAGVGALADAIRKSECGPGGSAPAVLAFVPPEVRRLTGFAEMFAESREKSRALPAAFAAVAAEKGFSVLDIGRTVRYGDTDGIHFEADQLPLLGKLAAGEVRRLC